MGRLVRKEVGSKEGGGVEKGLREVEVGGGGGD